MDKIPKTDKVNIPNAVEGNRLIAEFMGYTIPQYRPYYNYPSEYPYRLQPYKKVHPHIRLMPDQLKYHSSWDWLMPVLEKISRITLEWENSDDRTETYYPRTFGMLSEETSKPMVRINGQFLHEADTLIEATYLAVVDFIKIQIETHETKDR